MVQLNNNARLVCKVHYKEKCGVCPLRPECVTGNRITTKEQLSKETIAMNERANQIVKELNLCPA